MTNKIPANEQQQIQTEIHALEKRLKKYPPGEIVFYKNAKYFSPFYLHNNIREYLPKSKRALITQLVEKSYWYARIEDLQNHLSLLKLQSELNTTSFSHTERLLDDPCFAPYLSSLFSLSDELSAWASEDFPSDPPFPEKRIHNTAANIKVRSKSEVLITNALYTHQIPFRYECMITLGFHKLHPDFTIRHPATGKIYLWEHYGTADDPRYMNDSLDKQKLYIANGFIPSTNLILTYETQNTPLTMDTIERVIREYFL